MTDQPDARSTNDSPAPHLGEPLLVEDVLLLLFQPDSGSIAGENILFYVLGGAALGDLALQERIEMRNEGALTSRIHALDAHTPRPTSCSRPGSSTSNGSRAMRRRCSRRSARTCVHRSSTASWSAATSRENRADRSESSRRRSSPWEATDVPC